MFIPILWKIPILINIFSDGLKLETTKQLHPRRLRNRTWKWWELGRWFSSSRGPVFSGSSRWSNIVQMGWNHQAVTLLGTNISPQKGTFEDDFPYPKVGYVSSLEGKYFLGSWLPRQVRCFFLWKNWPGFQALTLTPELAVNIAAYTGYQNWDMFGLWNVLWPMTDPCDWYRIFTYMNFVEFLWQM